MSSAHDDIWAALANPLRRRILDVLSAGPTTTGGIVSALDGDRHVVMQHLRVLREVGLVHVEPRGRERLNYLNPVPLQDAVGRWISRYEQNWAAALVGLRDTLEGPANQAAGGPETETPRTQAAFGLGPVDEQTLSRRTRGA